MLTFFSIHDTFLNNFYNLGGFYMKDLETNRLILRKFKETDVDDMYEIASDHNIEEHSFFAEHSIFCGLNSKEETLRVIESAIQDYGTYESCWAIELKETNKVIGHIRIDHCSLKNRQCTLIWSISQKYWGLGYIEEILKTLFKYLFENHPFDIIVVRYYSDSEFSNPVLISAGMQRDAVLRYRRINSNTGKKESLVVYSILKEEVTW